VIWGARTFAVLSAAGEGAERTDAAMRERAAASARNRAQWQREVPDKVSETR
jgi:hypothetical protein